MATSALVNAFECIDYQDPLADKGAWDTLDAMNSLRLRLNGLVETLSERAGTDVSFTSSTAFAESIRSGQMLFITDTVGSAGPIAEVLGALTSKPIESLFGSWLIDNALAEGFRERLRVLAESLSGAGLNGGLAYEGPEEEIIVEYGAANRALTFILDRESTVALYRSGSVDDYRNVAVVTMAPTPAAKELERVAKDYLVTLICQTSKTKVT